ncbi:DUF2304 domain-containing protein [Candidatus Beckwithbacteria bacterium CG10_big_fil_rev_8_21_14_0_10_34_10]|uniref:DUF2304 domain-containing protein n=1 Tax=Candidatus Beckwithbacteria bacterium CG10_big_fil_rev_8_21_14_0_10_34_10 TaxID=1974495 RepID=A0A2H0W9N6_9BACT|nr:MAG: DUF2304 domain-containing protein [Candidatus Beckwithbacteria bacterium CG10_big_fil_rev_8_21_14_0_10_34_10]
MNIIFLPVQILLSLFLLFAVSRVYFRFKEGTINFGSFLFWLALWLAALFTIFYPGFSNYWASLLGIGRGVDAIIYISIALLFYLVFRTNVIIENLREEISQLVREIALKDKPKKKKE